MEHLSPSMRQHPVKIVKSKTSNYYDQYRKRKGSEFEEEDSSDEDGSTGRYLNFGKKQGGGGSKK